LRINLNKAWSIREESSSGFWRGFLEDLGRGRIAWVAGCNAKPADRHKPRYSAQTVLVVQAFGARRFRDSVWVKEVAWSNFVTYDCRDLLQTA
jgi:hypothetical protein